MSVLQRATLEDSSLADLHAIASELSLDGYRRLRKADLIDALVEHQGGSVSSRGDEDSSRDDDNGSSAASRRRGRRGGRGRTGAASSRTIADPFVDDIETEEEAAARARAPRGGAGGGRSAREGRDGNGGRSARESRDGREGRGQRGSRTAPEAKEPKDAEPVIVEGVVELLAGGSGFVRVSPPDPSDEDVYISAAQVKRCELVAGDRISGPRRPPHRSERFPSLVRIDTVNGKPAGEISDRTRFDDLPAEFPVDRFKLGSDDATLKAIEPLAPFGRGSRVTITGAPWSGKSHLLKLIAAALSEQKDLTVFLALAGVRPEELGEWSHGPLQPGAAVSFAASSDAQDHAAELVVDQAKRLAARGDNAVVLIDTLDGLHTLTARKILASARNIKDGGSLTVIATAAEPLGGETTVIALNATLARGGNFPAIKLPETGTLRPELLVGEKGAKAIAKALAAARAAG